MAHTSVTITHPDITSVTATSSTAAAVAITTDQTQVQVNNLAIPSLIANEVEFTAYGSITATDVEGALQQLADQSFRSADAPTGGTVEQGDLWYETDTETLHLYREVSSNVFNWIPIAMATGDSDTLDGGSY